MTSELSHLVSLRIDIYGVRFLMEDMHLLDQDGGATITVDDLNLGLGRAIAALFWIGMYGAIDRSKKS